MGDHKELEALFEKHGFTDFKWFDPRDTVVSQWVRIKCMYGCADYRHNAACPPNVPSVQECREFFGEYVRGVIFHFEKTVPDPEDRHAWSREVNRGLSELEREVFLSGYPKAFLLFMDNCQICAECVPTRGECRNPESARPSPEAMGVDVFATVEPLGYPIEVLTDYAQPMNRFAFLLIE